MSIIKRLTKWFKDTFGTPITIVTTSGRRYVIVWNYEQNTPVIIPVFLEDRNETDNMAQEPLSDLWRSHRGWTEDL
jgi:hypothetical protein